MADNPNGPNRLIRSITKITIIIGTIKVALNDLQILSKLTEI